MCVEDPVDVRVILEEAERLIDEVEAFKPLVGASRNGASPLQVLSRTELNNALKMLLTLIERDGREVLRHYIAVALTGYGLAARMGADEAVRQTVAIGGMFHDAGELYIDPEILRHGSNLSSTEWRHVFAHPVIGQKLIAEVSQFDPAVTTAMLEHHERHNGNGYPRKVFNGQISPAGQVLGVAESVSELLLHPSHPLERAEIAVKVIPTEFSPAIVAAVANTAREVRTLSHRELLAASGPELRDRLELLCQCIGAAQQQIVELRAPMAEDAVLSQLVAELEDRLESVARALARTGLNARLDDPGHRLLAFDDAPIAFEIGAVIDEIIRRLREIRRDLVTRCAVLPGSDAEWFDRLLGVLATAEMPLGACMMPGKPLQ